MKNICVGVCSSQSPFLYLSTVNKWKSGFDFLKSVKLKKRNLVFQSQRLHPHIPTNHLNNEESKQIIWAYKLHSVLYLKSITQYVSLESLWINELIIQPLVDHLIYVRLYQKRKLIFFFTFVNFDKCSCFSSDNWNLAS